MAKFRSQNHGDENKDHPNSESSRPAEVALVVMDGLDPPGAADSFNINSSSVPRKGAAQHPVSTRPPSSVSVKVSQPPAAAAAAGGGGTLNPVGKIFKDLDLGKILLGLVVPLAVAFLTPHAPASGLLRDLVLSSICFGFAALLNGILLQEIIPRWANLMQQSGAALLFLAFYGLITALLPDNLKWIPWLCSLLILIPFFIGLASHYLGINTNS